MENPKAILDTSGLIRLQYTGLLPFLNLFYDEVRLPSHVEVEFITGPETEEEQTQRFEFISSFYQDHSSWFVPCNEYGEDLIQIYLSAKNMDRGEAEVLAQNQFYDNQYELILDEKVARELAGLNNMKCKGTLSLLAHMDLGFGLCDYHEIVEQLRQETNFFLKDKIIQKAYLEAQATYPP